MPASTPNFGIVYPCGGDTIDPAVFRTYADTTQTALNTVQTLINTVPFPPAVMVRRAAADQVIGFGAATVMSFDTEAYDRGGMWSPGLPTLIVLPANGTYMATFQAYVVVEPATTFTSFRVAINVNGVEVAAQESDAGSTGKPAYPLVTSLLIPATTIGTPVTATVLITGSGGAPSVQGLMTVTQVANV